MSGLTIFINHHPSLWRRYLLPSITTRQAGRVGLFFVWLGLEFDVFTEAPND